MYIIEDDSRGHDLLSNIPVNLLKVHLTS